MATNYTSKKLSYDNAYNFLEAIADSSLNHIKYVFLGNSNSYVDEQAPPDITDTVANEKSVWDNMFAAKKVTGNDVKLVIPRINWENNSVYKQFDDTILLDDLTTANGEIQPMYVITSDLNVYKCLSNNIGSISTIEPTGDYSSSNGYISTGGTDNYLWKYMFSVKPSNKYLTDNWIPVPTSVTELDYGTSEVNVVDGVLAQIFVEESGSGYINSTIEVDSFLTGCTILKLADTSNVAGNMAISGTGIISGSYITTVDTNFNLVTISLPTSAAGGNTGNNVTVSTRVVVDGDGNDDVVATANILNSGINRIDVSFGTGYTRANVIIYGTGNGASARAVLPPKYGHGFNPAKELNSAAIMVSKTIGAIDSTEDGLISTDTSFRQVGLLTNPHKYGQAQYADQANANTVISQTTDLTLVPGISYTLNEFVYQGTSSTNPTFSGIVHAQDANTVRLINVKGTVTIGGLLISLTTNRAVISEKNPDMQPYSGDILYVENDLKTERADGQAETIKFVIQF